MHAIMHDDKTKLLFATLSSTIFGPLFPPLSLSLSLTNKIPLLRNCNASLNGNSVVLLLATATIRFFSSAARFSSLIVVGGVLPSRLLSFLHQRPRSVVPRPSMVVRRGAIDLKIRRRTLCASSPPPSPPPVVSSTLLPSCSPPADSSQSVPSLRRNRWPSSTREMVQQSGAK